MLHFDQFLECQSEYQITRIARDGAFVLSPKEWPIVVILKMVGLAEEDAGCHIAGNEGEIGAIVAVKY